MSLLYKVSNKYLAVSGFLALSFLIAHSMEQSIILKGWPANHTDILFYTPFPSSGLGYNGDYG